MSRTDEDAKSDGGESLGFTLVIGALVFLLILNATLCYSVGTSDALSEIQKSKLGTLSCFYVILGVICLAAAIDMFGGGFHSCMLSLPIALGNYVIAVGDLLLCLKSEPTLPTSLRVLFGVALGMFALGHLVLIFGGRRPPA